MPKKEKKKAEAGRKDERTKKVLAEEAANGYLTRKIVIAKEWEEQATRGEINLKHVFVDPGSTHLVEAVDDGDVSDEGGLFNRYHYSAERLKWDSGVFKQQKHLERLKKGEINAIERELQLHPKDRTDLQSIRARNQTVFKHLFTLIDFYASDRVSLQRWQNHIGKERAITHLAHELVSMRPPPGGKKERSKNEPFSFEIGHASGGRVTRRSTYNHRKTKAYQRRKRKKRRKKRRAKPEALEALEQSGLRATPKRKKEMDRLRKETLPVRVIVVFGSADPGKMAWTRPQMKASMDKVISRLDALYNPRHPTADFRVLTIVVDEFKTSACCRVCDTNSMDEVTIRKANWREIPDERERTVTPWELRACCNDECPEYQKFVNRNFNACINMRRIYRHMLVHGVRSRPAGLSRTPRA